MIIIVKTKNFHMNVRLRMYEYMRHLCKVSIAFNSESEKGGGGGWGMASEIHEIFYAFGPQLNTFMSVGIWLKYFCRKLLQFE